MLQFAVRRMGFVLKWALVIVLATLALIHLPLFVEAWITGDPIGWRTLVVVERLSRPTLAAIMLLLATVQIRLVLHNDSLRGASSRMDVSQEGMASLPCFLLAGFSLLFLLQILRLGGKRLARCRHLEAGLVDRAGNRRSDQRADGFSRPGFAFIRDARLRKTSPSKMNPLSCQDLCCQRRNWNECDQASIREGDAVVFFRNVLRV